jgi:hypothetical protein
MSEKIELNETAPQLVAAGSGEAAGRDTLRRGASLLFACLGKINLTDYLHCNRSFTIGCSDFLKSFHDTSTLESSQWLDHSLVEGVSILGRRIRLPKPPADPDFQ